MNAWKVILATLVIFGAGVITGGLLVSFSDHATRPGLPSGTPENPRRNTAIPVAGTPRQNKLPPPLPGPLRKDFLDRLDRDLKLTSTQRVCIEKIICEGQEQAKSIWQDVEPEMHGLVVDTRTRICSELTPEQRARFEQSVKQRARNASHPAGPTNLPVLLTNAPGSNR